jgi:hypothetical protein
VRHWKLNDSHRRQLHARSSQSRLALLAVLKTDNETRLTCADTPAGRNFGTHLARPSTSKVMIACQESHGAAQARQTAPEDRTRQESPRGRYGRQPSGRYHALPRIT